MKARFLLLLILSSLGCGYSAGYKMPPGVIKLAVPMFENQTFPLRREIEYDMTRAVRQELELRTDAILVARGGEDAVTPPGAGGGSKGARKCLGRIVIESHSLVLSRIHESLSGSKFFPAHPR